MSRKVFILALVSEVLIFLCIVCLGLGMMMRLSSSFQATSTARVLVRTTEKAQPTAIPTSPDEAKVRIGHIPSITTATPSPALPTSTSTSTPTPTSTATASPTKTSTPRNVYHSNDKINYLITEFNKLSPTKVRDVSSWPFSYQAFLTVDDVFVRISGSGNFVDLTDELPPGELSKLLKYSDIFIRITFPKITDDQLHAIHQELVTSGKSEFSDISYRLIELRKVNNGEMIEYRWSTYIPDRYLE